MINSNFIFKKNNIKLVLIALYIILISNSCDRISSSMYIHLEKKKTIKSCNNTFGKYISKIQKATLSLLGIYSFQQIPITEGFFFRKLPSHGSNLIGNSINKAFDKGYWVAGKNKSSSSGVFAKFNEAGGLELTRHLSGFTEVKYIEEDGFDNVAIAGIITDSSGINNIGIGKITSASNYKTISFCKSFGGIYNDDSVYIHKLSDESLVTTGTTIMSEANMKDAVAILVDKNGNFIYANRYGDNKNNIVLTSTIEQDSTLKLSGYNKGSIENIFFLNINPNSGSMTGPGTELLIGRKSRVNSISTTLGDDLLFTGSIAGKYGSKNLIAGKIGSHGSSPIYWTTELSKFYKSDSGSIEGLGIKEKSDGSGVIVVANMIDYNDLNNPLGSVVICNLNADGNFIEAFKLEGDSLDIARSFLLTPTENNIITFGETSSYSDNTGFFLTSLSSNGNTDCSSPINLSETSLTGDIIIDNLKFNQTNIGNDSITNIACSSIEKKPSYKSISCINNDEKNYMFLFWILITIVLVDLIIMFIYLVYRSKKEKN